MFDRSFLLSEISIINKNYTRNRRTCQDFFKQDVKPLPSEPLTFIKQQDSVIHQLLTILARFENYYVARGIYLTQTTLARMLGISRQYCNYLIGKLIASGFLLSNYRHKTSCEYKLSSYFRDTTIRNALAHLIPSFKWLSIYLLTPVMLQAETISKSVTTQIKSHSVYYIYLAKKNSNKLHKLPTCKRIAGQEWLTTSQDLQKIKKSEKNMNNPPRCEFINYENLTPIGEARLSSFPEAALSWAASRMVKHKGIKDEFSYFVKLCKIYCQDHGIEPDWSLSQSLISKQNLDPAAPPLKGSFLIQKQVAKPYHSKYTAPQKTQKREGDKEEGYKKAMERYKASKPASHPINRKTFHDEYTEQEILMELHKLDQYSSPEHMQPLIKLMGEKAAYGYHAHVKQHWLDKLAKLSPKPPDKVVPPKTLDEIDWGYSPNYDDDELYEEIIEEIVW